jgi:CRP-like cAMP-binding protein
LRTDPVESARFYLHGLASLHLRRPVSADEVAWVLRQAPPVEVEAGQVLFREGAPADSALLVVHGELVALVGTPDGERVVGTVGAWDIVGETALYATGRARSATVRARRDSTCLEIRRELLDTAGDNAVVAAIEYLLMHTLTHRVRVTNQAIQEAWRALESGSDRRAEPADLPAIRLRDLLGSRG